MSRSVRYVAFGAVAVGLASAGARAGLVDLTGGAGSSGTINGAVYQFDTIQPAGSGVFDPFVRIRMHGTEQGYNTSNPDKPFDELGGTWTHDLTFGELATVTVDGTDYIQFNLDINEENSPNGRYLSLDEVQIFSSSIGSQNGNGFGGDGVLQLDASTLHYRMDAGEDSYVRMDYTLGSGSGESDMTTLIPLANFAGVSPDDYIYLYSFFGQNDPSGAGFEEWAAVTVPGPSAALLLGLAGLGQRRRRR